MSRDGALASLGKTVCADDMSLLVLAFSLANVAPSPIPGLGVRANKSGESKRDSTHSTHSTH